jgi:hypothetical protein
MWHASFERSFEGRKLTSQITLSGSTGEDRGNRDVVNVPGYLYKYTRRNKIGLRRRIPSKVLAVAG